jgi:8-oxo-dGTP pyrophosphatase MutT (NUDIX family)
MISTLESEHSDLQKKVPVFGCICLNPEVTHVLVVHHVLDRHQYSFPKGKARQGETGVQTAARETLEESGVDVSQYIVEGEKFAYKRQGGRAPATMYLVAGVPMGQNLRSPSPLEICNVRWMEIGEIKQDRPFHPDRATKDMEPQIAKFIAKKRQGN